jgi:flavin reductase (DIM6/NTAB) family NADH-FMN oxidoreductase RutF
MRKKHFPVTGIRKFLEPGPIVLVTSHWKDKTNIMTMGWYTVMEFSPSLIGCVISSINYSHKMIRKSKECVINIPMRELANEVVKIGTHSGKDIDKFSLFKLTPAVSKKVAAPSIKECYANFECKLVDVTLVSKYDYFIFEIVNARIAIKPKYPKTIHYRGEGIFMVSGDHISFKKELGDDKSY